MYAYSYRALNAKTGRIQKGRAAAAHENELSSYLKQLDLELIDAKVHRTFIMTHRKTATSELIHFCGGLRDMLGAGVHFEEAFQLYTETQEQGSFRDTLHRIGQDIKAGSGISAAFALHPVYFDQVFVALMKTGEASGDIAAAFDHLVKHLQRQDQVAHQVRRALRYPLFLLCLAISVVSFMLLFVIPSLTEFLTSLSQTLPWSTRLLLASASAFETLWWILPLVAIMLWLGVIFFRRTSEAATISMDRLLLNLPILGPVLRRLILVRFMTGLTMLVKSGHRLPQALELVQGMIHNRALGEDVRHARIQLISGMRFSQAAGMFLPPFALQMLKVAEKSGDLPKALDNLTKALAREAEDDVDRMLGMIEPALTMLVGGIMVWIILAVLGPVYSSLAPLSQGM